ncbi:HYR-like domain-containing protein [Maribellus mangrovi]|uniref:HYR-like domain-containing protein n=1 Tax=Maribellus mangrovi TaxID=3133146 RepID=UPI0030ED2F63
METFYKKLSGAGKVVPAWAKLLCLYWCRMFAVLFILLCCTMQYANSQIVTEGPAVKANFGIDADIYANYLLDPALAGETAVGTDDWFGGLYGGNGMAVFTPSGTFIANIISALAIDENLSFVVRMGVPRNSEIEIPSSLGDTIVWIDGVYARDNNTAGNGKDSSAFAGTSDKNFQDPSTWNTGIKDPYQKGDLIDVFGHMREDPSGQVWGIGAFSTRSSSGSVHADFEFFANQVGYNGMNFTNTGGDHGHTSWTFDRDNDGIVLTAGDLIVSIDYEKGGDDPVASIRVWVSEDDYNWGLANFNASSSFSFTGAFTTESGAGFGYAEIQPAVDGVDPAAWAVVNVDSVSPAPPWGTLEGPQADNNDGYLPLQFAEFAINMSFLGLDAFGGNACNKTLGSLLVKTRSSPSFESEMHDFVGPLLFGYDLETKIVAMPLDSCDDGENQFDLMTAVDSFGDGNVTFYATSADAFADPPVNAISSNQTLPVGDTMFWARSSNPDDESCFAVDSFMVTVHDNPVCNVTATDETYFNAGNGTAKVTVTGGEGPYTYLWVPSNGGTIGGGQNSDSIYGLTDGRYDVYITDANGCTTDCYGEVLWTPTAPTCAVFTVDVECYGAETGIAWAEVTPSDTIGYPPYTYIWYKDAVAFDTTITPNLVDTMFNLGAGIYDVEVFNAVDPNGSFCGDTIFQPDPNPVYVECSDYSMDGCQGQSAVDANFGNWLDTVFMVSGGTDPLDTVFHINDIEVDPDTVDAPDYCGGTVTIRMIVTDYCGLKDTCDATFTVNSDNTPPVISGVEADTTIECPSVPEWSTPTALDACFGEVTPTMSDDTTSYACPLVITRTWKAIDACGNSSTASQTITVIDTTPPVFSGVGADAEIECPDEPVWSTPTANDVCDGAITPTMVDDTTSYSCPLVITRTWKAIDACGNSSTASQTITVIDTTPPVFSGVGADAEIECPNEPVWSTPTANDVCDGAITPTMVDDTTSYSCPLVITRTWKAIDACGNSSTASQTITVIDTTPPVFSGVGADAEIECPDEPVWSTPTANDVCDGAITPTMVDDTTSYSCPLVITRTWKAIDACGNSSTASQTITVLDTTPPVFSGVGADAEIECPDEPVWSTPTANDVCDGAITPTMVDDTTSYSCPLVITRTWKAIDACGNSSTASQTITVIDTTPPVITGVDADTTIECPSVPEWSSPTASDVCDGDITPTMVDDTTNYSCPLVITRTWKAIDACGNSSTASQTITVIDTTPPVITITVVMDSTCNSDPVATATYTDECSDGGSITPSIRVVPIDPSDPNQCDEYWIFTFTAKDDCENTSTAVDTLYRFTESEGDCETAFGRLPEPDLNVDLDQTPYTTEIGAKCFLDEPDTAVFNRWGWTNRILADGDSTYTLDVYAGAGQCDLSKGTYVGTVDLSFAFGGTNTMFVDFDLLEGYVLTEAHIYAGTPMYPQKKNGKHKGEYTVAPGQYTVVWENDGSTGGIEVDITNVPEGAYIWVIVHSVVCIPTCDCPETVRPEVTLLAAQDGDFETVRVRGNKKSAEITTGIGEFEEGELKVFPNPFTEKVTFEFVSAKDAYGTLDIYSLTGQRVARILERQVIAGELNKVFYEPDHDVTGVYLYRLDLDGDVQVGRIIYKK